MEYRSLGRTGANVSPLCLGTDNFMDPTPEDECKRILDAAMDAGINLLDTGDVYADGDGERVIGRILKEERKAARGPYCDQSGLRPPASRL